MIYQPLDSISEKILALYTKKRILSIQSVANILNMEWYVVAEYVKLLVQDNYLGPYSINAKTESIITAEMAFIIDTKGLIYFDLQRKYRIMTFQNSVLVPIAVTLITNTITKVLAS